MPDVRFEDNSAQVINALEDAVVAFLEEVGGEIEAQVKRNTRVDTSKTKGSWTHVVDEGKQQVTIGNPLQNAIWEEFGTGEYAVHGDGRKTPWVYKDIYGKWHRTTGKKPTRALQKAIDSKKGAIQRYAQSQFGSRLK